MDKKFILVLMLFFVFPTWSVAYGQPPQHINYELAPAISLPPGKELLISWVTGNLSFKWGYFPLTPLSKIKPNLPLFYVSGLSKEVLWRVDSFDFFDGKGWAQFSYKCKEYPLKVNVSSLTSFTVIINKGSLRKYVGILPVPSMIETVKGLTVSNVEVKSYLTDTGSVLVSGNVSGTYLLYNISYQERIYNLSKISLADVSDVPSEVKSRFTSLPSKLPPELVEAAEKVKNSSLTMAGQVKVLIDFLKGFKYVSEVDFGNVSTYEAISLFFKKGKGDSFLFSTVFTLLSREIGIPARLVVGFKPVNISGNGYWVHSGDEYCWAEVFFPGVGWCPVDPSPSKLETIDVLPLNKIKVVHKKQIKKSWKSVISNKTASNVNLSAVNLSAEKENRLVGNENASLNKTNPEKIKFNKFNVSVNASVFQNKTRFTSSIQSLAGNIYFLVFPFSAVLIAVLAVSFSLRRKREEEEEKLNVGGAVESKEKEEDKLISDLEKIVERVAAFYDSSNFREGVLFLGDLLVEMASKLNGVEKKRGETVREFFLKVFNKYKKNESDIQFFTRVVEKAKYGREEITSAEYLKTIFVFSLIIDFFINKLGRGNEKGMEFKSLG